MANPFDMLANMLGAKSGQQLGEENRKAAGKPPLKKPAPAPAAQDRSTAGVFKDQAQLQDDVMAELRRQSGQK